MSKKREFRNCFVGIQGWMMEDMGLYGNELVIYAVINSVCQIPGMSYYGSKEYLGRFVGSTRTAIRILNRLIEKGYIKKKNISGKKTEYIALITDKESAKKQTEVEESSVTNCHTKCDNLSYLSVSNCHTKCDKMSHNINKDIYNNIYKIDRQEENGCLSAPKNNIPTLEEVTEYVKVNGLPIDPKKFYEKNQERGWITKNGKPIKRWKSVLWSWAETEYIQKSKPDKNSFMQNTYDFEALEKDLVRN